jgi:hypothetical protein
MTCCRATQHESNATRRGIATLEFAMSLPILLLLMVAITWLGFSVIGQTEVLVQARNKAWKKRFDNKNDQPLHFPILPGYNQENDFVAETASKTIDVSPIFKVFPGPKAGCVVLAGSWDWRAMSLDKPPDLKLMATAAAIGWGGNVLNWMSEITNPLGLLKTLGSQVQSQANNAPGSVGKDDGTGSGSDGTSPVPGAPSDGLNADQAKEKDEAERKKAIDADIAIYHQLGARLNPINDNIEVYGGDLKKSEDAITAAQKADQTASDAARNETDKDKQKDLQQKSAAAHRKVELLKIEDARLRAALMDVIDDLDALGIDKWDLYAGKTS